MSSATTWAENLPAQSGDARHDIPDPDRAVELQDEVFRQAHLAIAPPPVSRKAATLEIEVRIVIGIVAIRIEGGAAMGGG